MPDTAIDALSPLDGRYAGKLAAVRYLFSEAGLMRERVRAECAWVLAWRAVPPRPIWPRCRRMLASGSRPREESASTDVGAIKIIEWRTNHDVKAVEYWIRGQLQARGALPAQLEWVHFGCTSEDINNLAYALMLKGARSTVLVPALNAIGADLDELKERYASVPMLARTPRPDGHADDRRQGDCEYRSPPVRTAHRAGARRHHGQDERRRRQFQCACGGIPACRLAGFQRALVASLGLESNAYTTQIEPHDWIAEYCHALMRANTVLFDFARDMWSYISLGYFRQRPVEGEVGSSTMPHKVNPIDLRKCRGQPRAGERPAGPLCGQAAGVEAPARP